MEKLELQDFDQDLPAQMQVAVLMEKRPSSHPWADFAYDAIEVVVHDGGGEKTITSVHRDGEVEQYLVAGLDLRLHVDECESYYHNLMSPEPGCFIVADQPEEAETMPVPYIVSLSFDEAHAYLEGDELVYSLPIPPELYKWAEAYVLTHYVAIKKTKRKLRNWSETEKPGNSDNQPV